jgi:hypothetical protein
MNNESFLKKVVAWDDKKAVISLKSVSEGHENP